MQNKTKSKKLTTLTVALATVVVVVIIGVVVWWRTSDTDIVGKWVLVSDANFTEFKLADRTPYELHFFPDGTGVKVVGNAEPESLEWSFNTFNSETRLTIIFSDKYQDTHFYYYSFRGAGSRLIINRAITVDAPKVPHFAGQRELERGTRITFKRISD